jgi:hypothetical protein
MNRATITELRPGLSIKQISTKKLGVITTPPAGASLDLDRTWVDFGAGPEPVSDGDIEFTLRRIRLTVPSKPKDPADDLRQIAKLRRDLWAHSPVEVDSDNPAYQTRRDAAGNAYFEFATEFSSEVRRVLNQFGYADCVTMQELGEVGLVCTRCGFLSGFVTVCPNCKQRDIEPCPHCRQEIFRDRYELVGGDLFICPNCRQRVRLQFNDLDNDVRSVNAPVVLVKDAQG